jgi:Lipase (class 3)
MIELGIIKTAASLMRATYAYPGDLPTTWDHWDNGHDDGVVWGAKKVDGVWYIALRGSVILSDWIHDAEAVAIYCSALNAHVHPGFNWGMEKVYGEVSMIVGTDYWISCGHSLGAARADNLTAYAIKSGHPPIARVVCGEPKPGFKDFCDIVSQVDGVSFINRDATGHDLVPDVPLKLEIAPYSRPSALLPLDVTPPPFDGIDLFRFHHMTIYDPAIRSLEALPAPEDGSL